MKIQVLGPGCRNCEVLYNNVVKALDRAGLHDKVPVEKVRDIDYFIKMGVFNTPGLVVDGEVISTGKVLNPDQVLERLQEKGLI